MFDFKQNDLIMNYVWETHTEDTYHFMQKQQREAESFYQIFPVSGVFQSALCAPAGGGWPGGGGAFLGKAELIRFDRRLRGCDDESFFNLYLAFL